MNLKTLLFSNLIFACLLFGKSDAFSQKNIQKIFNTSPFNHNVFVENNNQFENERTMGKSFNYMVNSNGVDVFINKNELTYIHRSLPKMTEAEREKYEKESQIAISEKLKPETHIFQIQWINTNTNVEVVSEEKQKFYYTYSNPANINQTIKADCYKKIIYKNIYTGIDLEYTLPEKGGIKYAFIVHPGADLYQIKYKYNNSQLANLDAFGNIQIETEMGEFTEYAPLSFLSFNKTEIKSSFKIENGIISFDIASYDNSQELTIDPWIMNPNFANNNQSYDVNFDLAGNVYAHGSIFPYKVVKYDAQGQLLWLYNAPFNFGTCGFGNHYGDFAVDEVSQSIYIGEGYCQSRVLKLDKQGLLMGTYPGTCAPDMNEMWRLEYNRCVNKVVIAGGGTGSTRNQFATLDTTLNSVTTFNPLNATEDLHDIALLAFDPTGNFFYSATSRSTGYPANYNNILYKMPSNTIVPATFGVYDTYTFQEGASLSNFGWNNGQFASGFNGLASGLQYIYLYDGNKLQQRSKTNGALVNEIFTSSQAMSCGGIAVDPCENIYVAVNNVIEVYDVSLNLIGSYNTNSTIYDIKLGPKGILYFCGDSQVGTVIVTNSAPVLSYTSTPNSGCGQNCNGTATVNVSCGNISNYTFAWSNGQTTQTATGLCAGTHTVIVTTACILKDTLIVTVGATPGSMSVSAGPNLILGCNNTTGSIIASAIPSAANYSWAGSGIVSGNNTNTITVNATGTYTVTASDNNGCSATATVTVSPAPLPTLFVSSSSVICFGANSASSTASATGGTAPYNYTWNTTPAQNTATATNLSAGTYTCTVTDANGCTATNTTTIVQGSSITLNILSTDVTCHSGNNGSANATTNGGTPAYTYSWSTTPVQTTSTASNLSAGTYTCTVTDANGCTSSSFVTINQPTALVTNISSSTDVSCNGACNGSATVTASGAIPNYTYSWNTLPVQTTTTANGLCSGTYVVTVTDLNGCTASTSAIINQQPSITTTISSTNVLCNGGATGTATITANGGTPAYSYLWNTSPAQTTATATGIAAGTYTCTVTDANGCTATNSVNITQPLNLVATISSSSNSTCNGQCNGSATVSVNGGTPAYSYSWNSTPTQNTATATGLCAGTYIVTITDVNGCTASASVTITEPNALVASNITGTNVLCNGNATGNATVVPTGGTPVYTFTWNTSPVQTGSTASNLAAGTYIVTVTDANGCTVTNSITINEPTLLLATISSTNNVSCNGLCDGSAVATASGGTASYSYSWNTTPVQTTNTIHNLCAGAYVVTVTDMNGCSASATANINQQSSITATITSTNVLCNGGATGTATITASGGTPNYSYSWNTVPAQTNATATNLAVGTYTCTITDANGCTATNSTTITQPANLSASISSSTKATCNGQCNGTATVIVNGGTPSYSYSWNSTPVQTSATATGLCAGNYIVTATDINGCSDTATVTIIEPPVLVVSTITATDVTCNAGNNGSATASASGGTPSYSYSWNTSPIETTATASNLYAGNYIVTITDMNGCTTTSSIAINQPTALNASISSINNVTCFGACNGTATVTVTGGTASYTYSWNTSPFQTAATVTGLCPGTYNVIVTDMNGCTTSVSTTNISEPPPLAATITPTNVLCNGGNTGSASITATGGTPSYTYVWTTSPIQTNASAISLPAGAYSCTVTDLNGCTTTSSVSITEPVAISGNITTSNVKCFGQCDGIANITANGGAGNYNYLWNTIPAQTTANATGLCSGNYIVTITDNNGCTQTASTTITQPVSGIAINITNNSSVNCYGGNNGSVTVAASGGTAAYNYSWNTSPIQTGATATNLSAGSYTCTVTDANGCVDSSSVTIIQPSPIGITTHHIDLNCDNLNSATVDVSGGTGTYTYVWNTTPAQTTSSLSNVPGGTYMLTVTDANGCTQTHTVIITNNYVAPIAGFSVAPNIGSIYSNSLFVFTDNSTNGNTWQWDFGDGSSSNLQHPTHTYADTGTYCITQTVLNMPSGCKDVHVYCVKVEADWTFYVPNAFTPDGDGLNDYFMGKGTGIKKYKMIVFDRWGDEIFETSDILIGWDGKANRGNEIAQQDVYVYKILLTDIKDKEHQYIGHFTLVK